MRALIAAILAALVASPAAALELSGALTQGALIVGTSEPDATVYLDGRKLRVDPQTGAFAFGLGRDQGGEARLTVVTADGQREERVLTVVARQWQIERIDGLSPRKVTPSAEDLARIRREAELIAEARANDSAGTAFAGGFVWPVEGRVSGRYGSQRILNGEPRRPHLGLDIAAPAGTPVVAAAAGKVVLAETDLFYTGGTVVIDHGHGVTTIYSHLASVEVGVGEPIAQGARLGTVGATGRATGPHLDWRINWFDVRLDPELVVPPNGD